MKKLWRKFGTKLVSFFLIAMCVVVISCGHRTTTKNRTEIKNDTLSINSYFELKQNSGFNDILELKPIDNAKPIIYNGISYYNASIRFYKSKFDNLEIKGKENLSQSGSISLLKEKKTEKTDYSNVYIGLFFVFAGGFLLFFRYVYLRLVRSL